MFKQVLCLSSLLLWSCKGQEPGVLMVSLPESNNQRYLLSARYEPNVDNCGGSNVDDGWDIAVEQLYARAGKQSSAEGPTVGGFFNTANGRFTAPVDGVYYISAYARCETQKCDITIRAAFDIVAAFGTDLVRQVEKKHPKTGSVWSTHGVATMVFLREGQTAYLKNEAGSSTDCIRDTNFQYGQFNVILYFATEEITELP